MDEKLHKDKAKKQKETSEDKMLKNKLKQSSKIPKTNQNASEMSTKQPRMVVTKENAVKIITPMKSKAGKPIEASVKSEMNPSEATKMATSNNNPTFKPKQDEPLKTDEAKDGGGLATKANVASKQHKFSNPEPSHKFIKSYVKKFGERPAVEQIVTEATPTSERDLDKIAKRNLDETSSATLDEPKDETESVAEDTFESIWNPTLDAFLPSKQLTRSDSKAFKTPCSTPSLSKVTSQAPSHPQASKNHPEANNLRIKTHTRDLPVSGSQQDRSKYSNKGLREDRKVDSGSKTEKDNSEEPEFSRRKDGMRFESFRSAALDQLPKALKVSDKDNRLQGNGSVNEALRDQSPSGLKNVLTQTKPGIFGNITRSSSTLAPKKSLKPFAAETMRKSQTIKSESTLNTADLEEYVPFESSFSSTPPPPPPPPSSTPLLLSLSSVVTATADLPSSHLR